MVENRLYKNFAFWLGSIIEDFSIPLEIDNIIFIIIFSKKNICLMMGGCEKNLDIHNLQYFPSESEFFYDSDLKICYYKNHIKDLLSEMIYESMSDPMISNNLKNKKVYAYLNKNYEKIM